MEKLLKCQNLSKYGAQNKVAMTTSDSFDSKLLKNLVVN